MSEILRLEQKLDEIQTVVLKLPGQLDHLEYRIDEQKNAQVAFDTFKADVQSQINTMRGIGLTVAAIIALVNVIPAIVGLYTKIAGQ
jgi:hypothetical protein